MLEGGLTTHEKCKFKSTELKSVYKFFTKTAMFVALMAIC
jgi:hypothetical protein